MRELLSRYVDAYNSGDWDRLDELVTPDYIHHNCEEALDLAQFKSGAQWIRRGIPDFRIEIADVIDDGGEKLAVRFVGRGRHLGSLLGETPTSREIAVHGIMIYRFRDGLIAEDWEAMDEQQFVKQIASDPS